MATVTQTWQEKNNYTELNCGNSLKLSSPLTLNDEEIWGIEKYFTYLFWTT